MEIRGQQSARNQKTTNILNRELVSCFFIKQEARWYHAKIKTFRPCVQVYCMQRLKVFLFNRYMDFTNLQNKDRIVFIRHGKVDLPYASHADMPFDVLVQLSRQELDPKSDYDFFLSHKNHFENLFKNFNFKQIFFSSSNRCVTLFSYIKNLINLDGIKTEETAYIKEMFFDLEKLFTNGVVDLPALKEEIEERLLNEQPGVEPLPQVQERLQKFVNLIPNSGDTLVLTHGYLMMIIAGLYLSSGKMTKEILSSIPRFQYFDGFSINKDGKLEWIELSTG